MLVDLLVHVFILCVTVTMLLLTARQSLVWIMEINDLLKGIRRQR